MRIVMYGGSFNPPHRGHGEAAKAAMKALRADKFFLVPDRQPPHKELAAGSPSPEQRMKLTELAARELPGADVLDIELRRTGPSYTVDTLRQLKERCPGAEIVFLVGTDMFLSLESWRDPAGILALASVGVFQRAGGEKSTIEEMAAHYRAAYGARIYMIESEPLEISSSRLRELLPERKGGEYLSGAVYGEIIRQRLYGAKPGLAWLRERVKEHLAPKRVPHVLGTELEAVRLARRWGEDENDAAEAAILHDITKKLDRNEQLQLCQRYGIITDTSEGANSKLFHAMTGAALARELFGVPAHIESAIRWHTTGRPAMTRLEKIVYLADYIEPNRHGFEGLEELRKLAYEDLDAAMLFGLRLSIADLRAGGTEPQGDSLAAEKWFAALLENKQESL